MGWKGKASGYKDCPVCEALHAKAKPKPRYYKPKPPDCSTCGEPLSGHAKCARCDVLLHEEGALCGWCLGEIEGEVV